MIEMKWDCSEWVKAAGSRGAGGLEVSDARAIFSSRIEMSSLWLKHPLLFSLPVFQKFILCDSRPHPSSFLSSLPLSHLPPFLPSHSPTPFSYFPLLTSPSHPPSVHLPFSLPPTSLLSPPSPPIILSSPVVHFLHLTSGQRCLLHDGGPLSQIW